MAIFLTIAGVVLAVLAGLAAYTRLLARRAELAVPAVGRVHPVPGGAIHYVETGPKDAQPVVLIHGISAQLQHFTYAVADMLATDFRVIVIDRPGCGYSQRARDEDAALPSQARMIGAFLDDLDIARPVIVGHSLGGAVTLAIALARPDKVAAVGLIAPLTHVQEEIAPIFRGLEIRTGWLRRVVGWTVAAPLGKATAGKVLAFAFAPEPPVADFMVRAAGVLGLRPRAFVTAACDLVMLEDALPAQVARYPTLTVPGAVLYGSCDALLAPDLQGRTMTDYGLSYEELPGRGHMLPLTAPAECADFVRRVARLPAAAGSAG